MKLNGGDDGVEPGTARSDPRSVDPTHDPDYNVTTLSISYYSTPYCYPVPSLDLEPFFGKGTARRALKVFFKIKGFLSIIEGNCSFHTPGSIF